MEGLSCRGKLGMAWDFGSRKGDLAVTNFKAPQFSQDAVNVTGGMSIPGELDGTKANKFMGLLVGNAGSSTVNGSATGSFVRNGNDNAAGVIGNWNAGNGDIRAEGIFGAAKTHSYGIPTNVSGNSLR